MKLYLVRHTKVNIEPGFCYGQSDIGLADTFETEKQLILEKFKTTDFDSVYTSPLHRCRVLAEAIADHKCSVVPDDRLKELDFGSWEMQLWSELFLTPEAKNWFADFVNIPCPGGESYQQMIARVQMFLQELKSYTAGENIVIVCHSGTIMAFYSLLQDIDPVETFQIICNYGQVHEFEFSR